MDSLIGFFATEINPGVLTFHPGRHEENRPCLAISRPDQGILMKGGSTMSKMSTIFLAGMGMFLSPVAWAANDGGSVKRTVQVQIKGKLLFDPTECLEPQRRHMEIRRPFNVYWYVQAKGQHYYLDFGKLKEPRLIRGSTVIVTGTLESRSLWQIIHVSNLHVDRTETVTVWLHGTLRRSDIRFAKKIREPFDRIYQPAWYFINGITYSLNLSPKFQAQAEKIGEKPVIVGGELSGESITVTYLQEDNARYFRQPDSLVEIKAKLKDHNVLTMGGNIYRLNFADKKLLTMAQKLEGKTAVLSGVLKLWRLRNTQGADGGYIYEVQVNTIKPVEEEYLHTTVTVEIKGEVRYFLHIRFGRNAMNLQGYWLNFGSDDRLYELFRKLDSKTVTVTGTEEINEKKEKILHVTAVQSGE
jgi:hypothetical protein